MNHPPNRLGCSVPALYATTSTRGCIDCCPVCWLSARSRHANPPTLSVLFGTTTTVVASNPDQPPYARLTGSEHDSTKRTAATASRDNPRGKIAGRALRRRCCTQGRDGDNNATATAVIQHRPLHRGQRRSAGSLPRLHGDPVRARLPQLVRSVSVSVRHQVTAAKYMRRRRGWRRRLGCPRRTRPHHDRQLSDHSDGDGVVGVAVLLDRGGRVLPDCGRAVRAVAEADGAALRVMHGTVHRARWLRRGRVACADLWGPPPQLRATR